MAHSIAASDITRTGRSWQRRTEECSFGAPSDLWLFAWRACFRGDDAEGCRLIERLERHGEGPTQVAQGANAFGATLLHAAANGNCVGALRTLLTQPTTNVNVRNKGGTNKGASTALHWAASRGHTAAVRVLLESGADPSMQDLDGYTALRLALDRGYGDVADCLNPAGDDRAFGIGRACDTAPGRRSKVDVAARSQRAAFQRESAADPSLEAGRGSDTGAGGSNTGSKEQRRSRYTN